MMFALLTPEARRAERELRELLRTVDAARIGVAWSGQSDPPRHTSSVRVTRFPMFAWAASSAPLAADEPLA